MCRSCGPIAQDHPFLLQDVRRSGGETSLATRDKACNHVQPCEEHHSYPIVPNECIYTLGRPYFNPPSRRSGRREHGDTDIHRSSAHERKVRNCHAIRLFLCQVDHWRKARSLPPGGRRLQGRINANVD